MDDRERANEWREADLAGEKRERLWTWEMFSGFVPPQYQDLFPSLESALSALEETPLVALPPSLLLFWRLLLLAEDETCMAVLPRLAALNKEEGLNVPAKALAAYAHIVCAESVALNAAGQQYSERKAELLRRIPMLKPSALLGQLSQEPTLDFICKCSWRAVYAFLHLEAWDFARKLRQYEKALSHLAEGLFWAEKASVKSPQDEYGLGIVGGPLTRIMEYLVPRIVDVQEAAHTFSALTKRTANVGWTSVAHFCHTINDESSFGDVMGSTVRDAKGNEERWPVFWGKAEQYALSRSEANEEDLDRLLKLTEKRLHDFIRQRLQQELGKGEDGWWHQGIPTPIRVKCQERRELDQYRREKNPYAYTDTIDLKEVLDKNWKLFQQDFQRVKGQVKSKKDFLNDLVRLNEVRKIVMHPVRSAPTDADVEFVRQMRSVVEAFCGPG